MTSFVDASFRQKQVLQMLDRQIVEVVVSSSDNLLEHRHDQFFERP